MRRYFSEWAFFLYATICSICCIAFVLSAIENQTLNNATFEYTSGDVVSLKEVQAEEITTSNIHFHMTDIHLYKGDTFDIYAYLDSLQSKFSESYTLDSNGNLTSENNDISHAFAHINGLNGKKTVIDLSAYVVPVLSSGYNTIQEMFNTNLEFPEGTNTITKTIYFDLIWEEQKIRTSANLIIDKERLYSVVVNSVKLSDGNLANNKTVTFYKDDNVFLTTTTTADGKIYASYPKGTFPRGDYDVVITDGTKEYTYAIKDADFDTNVINKSILYYDEISFEFVYKMLYYDYGLADGSQSRTVMSYGKQLYMAKGLDAIPELVVSEEFSNPNVPTTTQRGNSYQADYEHGLTYTLALNAQNATWIYPITSSKSDASGLVRMESPDSTKQINYFFGATNDEGASIYQDVKVEYDGAWHTLDEAITAKKIKPLVPISIAIVNHKSGTLSGLMAGDAIAYKDWTSFIGLIIQANEGVTRVQANFGYWERRYAGYWECVDGRITLNANTFVESQYGQDTW